MGRPGCILLSEDQDLLVQRIPDARLVVYEGIGHALHWEAPERFASDLLQITDIAVH